MDTPPLLVTTLVLDRDMTVTLRDLVNEGVRAGNLPLLRGIAVEEALDRTIDRAILGDVASDIDTPQDAMEPILQALVTATPTYVPADGPNARWEAQQRYGRTLQQMVRLLQGAHGEGLFLPAGQYGILSEIHQRLEDIINAPQPKRFGDARNQMQLSVNVEGDLIKVALDRVDPDKP